MGTKAGIERDLQRILAVQALRAFAYGFGTVILPTALLASGLSDFQVGVVFTAMLAGMAVSAIGVGFLGDRVGRRRLYVGLLCVLGVAGIVFALTDSVVALVVAALTGTMSTDANESGPITSLEQAMIGQAPSGSRVHVFGRYNAVAYLAGAVGALAAGGPGALREALPSLPADQRWLLLFPVVAAACVVLAGGLSPTVESGSARPKRPLQRSRSNVVRLSSLFAVDAFAGGFIVTTFIVFWFERKFGASPLLMAVVIFASGLLQAGSSIVAARLGARFGLLRTMVFTHLPSNLLLLLLPLMPTLGLAIALLLARFSLSQMDVPTRQAYIAAMVDPEERTAAAAFTNTSRFVARPFGPAIGAALMSNVALGAPFVVAGALKSGYDLLLWRVFRRIELPEEAVVGGSA
jgi:MFS family permease